MRGPREEGAALLAVLLLIAVIAALSALALEKLRLATHLAANAVALDQARAFAVGGESVILARIGELAGPQARYTTLAGNWNGRAFRIPFPGGLATARVRDGGNCFNLNSVAQGLLVSALTTRPGGEAQFVALMESLGIDRNEGQRVAASVADWIDGDSVPNPGGAEDNDYAQAARPYRTANTLMSERSELRAVAGVTPRLYALLKPWVCALPTTDLSPIDVNTLSPDQAPLLRMMFPGRLDISRAREIIARRPVGGWENTTQFFQASGLEAAQSEDAGAQVQVKTRWFLLDLDVEVAGAQVTETALIDGGLAPPRLVLRRWGADE